MSRVTRSSSWYPVDMEETPVVEGTRVSTLRRIFQQDPTAAWRTLHSSLFKSCRRVCGPLGLSPHDADDVAHRALIGMLETGPRSLDDANGDVRLDAWTAGVARNHARQLLRERAKAAPLVDDLDRRAITPVAPEAMKTPGWVDLDLSPLTEPQREATELRLRGLTEREIAAVLGIRRDSVRDRLKRAVINLRSANRDGGSLELESDKRSWARNALKNTEKLDSRQIACLRLYLAGETRVAIAAELDTTPAAVASLLYRLRKAYSGRTT